MFTIEKSQRPSFEYHHIHPPSPSDTHTHTHTLSVRPRRAGMTLAVGCTDGSVFLFEDHHLRPALSPTQLRLSARRSPHTRRLLQPRLRVQVVPPVATMTTSTSHPLTTAPSLSSQVCGSARTKSFRNRVTAMQWCSRTLIVAAGAHTTTTTSPPPAPLPIFSLSPFTPTSHHHYRSP